MRCQWGREGWSSKKEKCGNKTWKAKINYKSESSTSPAVNREITTGPPSNFILITLAMNEFEKWEYCLQAASASFGRSSFVIEVDTIHDSLLRARESPVELFQLHFFFSIFVLPKMTSTLRWGELAHQVFLEPNPEKVSSTHTCLRSVVQQMHMKHLCSVPDQTAQAQDAALPSSHFEIQKREWCWNTLEWKMLEDTSRNKMHQVRGKPGQWEGGGGVWKDCISTEPWRGNGWEKMEDREETTPAPRRVPNKVLFRKELIPTWLRPDCRTWSLLQGDPPFAFC